MTMRIDLHTHSRVSDGTDSPSELVTAAAAAGLDVVALCDHDTFDGLPRACAAGDAAGVGVLPGIEISADHQGASVHLLGYGCRTDDQALAAELARVRSGRTERVPAMLANLAAAGMPVPAEVLARQVGDSPSIGRPHLADAMVTLGYVANRDEAFARWLADDRPIFVPRYVVDLEAGLRLVRRAGGVAVIAHPWGRVSRDRLPAELLARWAGDGILDGIEVDHQDHDDATRRELRNIAADLDLLATGSSDYHGSGKTGHDLGCNTTDPAVYAEILERIGRRSGVLRVLD